MFLKNEVGFDSAYAVKKKVGSAMALEKVITSSIVKRKLSERYLNDSWNLTVEKPLFVRKGSPKLFNKHKL